MNKNGVKKHRFFRFLVKKEGRNEKNIIFFSPYSKKAVFLELILKVDKMLTLGNARAS